MKKRKILYGISGIGNGHANRQAPIIEHFAKTSQMVIFAYQESYKLYAKQFKNHPSVRVIPIDVPFWVGDRTGLDFRASVRRNAGKDFISINCTAMAKAKQILGKPDLVITDYEPVSAQFGYAYQSPVVTLDQQSKYLCGNFPTSLGGQTFADEVMRLHMFFPSVEARIACSFFNVLRTKHDTSKVILFPSTLKESIVQLHRKPSSAPSILLYISSQRAFSQSTKKILNICSTNTNATFHIFTHNSPSDSPLIVPSNIHLYQHGDPHFLQVLAECTGIVSTAGHMLLSEAMHLGIPVYAMPLAVYEQQMNAYVIHKHQFGISHPTLDEKKLSYFIRHIPRFTRAIHADTDVLLRGPGQNKIIAYLERILQK